MAWTCIEQADRPDKMAKNLELLGKVHVLNGLVVPNESETVNYSWNDSRRDPRASPFMCQGAIYDWKNQFSVEDSQHLDKIYHDRLSGTDLESYFREYCT